MEKLSNDEVIKMLQKSLVYKYCPENMKAMLMVSVMDLGDDIQDEFISRNALVKDDDFYERGLQRWKELGLDK